MVRILGERVVARSCFFRPQSGAKSNQHRNRDLAFKTCLTHVFPRMAPVACFPVLKDSSCTFSRAWHRLHIFSAQGSGYVFSRAWQRLRVFPCFVPVICFPTLRNSRTFFLQVLSVPLRYLHCWSETKLVER